MLTKNFCSSHHKIRDLKGFFTLHKNHSNTHTHTRNANRKVASKKIFLKSVTMSKDSYEEGNNVLITHLCHNYDEERMRLKVARLISSKVDLK